MVIKANERCDKLIKEKADILDYHRVYIPKGENK
jgi:hypothetical protein